jgi:hypothetical protein
MTENTSSAPAGIERELSTEDWIRIARGLERLEELARTETDSDRRDHLWNVLGEARCC